jgi:hypothetical protein
VFVEVDINVMLPEVSPKPWLIPYLKPCQYDSVAEVSDERTIQIKLCITVELLKICNFLFLRPFLLKMLTDNMAELRIVFVLIAVTDYPCK